MPLAYASPYVTLISSSQSLSDWHMSMPLATFKSADQRRDQESTHFPRENYHNSPENDGWKAMFLVKWPLFRGHVDFSGGTICLISLFDLKVISPTWISERKGEILL